MVLVYQPNLISHIVEPTEQGRDIYPYPPVTYHVGKDSYPLLTARNNAVFSAHYPKKFYPLLGPVKALTIHHIGSSECPDVRLFAKTCKSVGFDGHLSSACVPFQVIKQLPNVNKVVFLIGRSQDYFLYDPYEKLATTPAPCPNVTKLKIQMDLEYFHDHSDCKYSNPEKCANGTCFSNRQFSLVYLVEALLKNSCESFPNLKNIILDFPENERLSAAVNTLVERCSGLRSKKIEFVKNISPSKICNNKPVQQSANCPEDLNEFPRNQLLKHEGQNDTSLNNN